MQLQQDDSGDLTVVGNCSCPVGYSCKHVVATLLSLRDRSARDPRSDGPSGLSPEVRNWLSRVEWVAASTRDGDPQRLLYLLRCEERFGLRQILVRVIRVRRLLAVGTIDPRDRNETLERVEQGVLIESGRDLSGESAAIRALEGLGLIRSLGEEDDAGLCFELPDDMGLGKTVQALAHLLAEQEGGRADRLVLATYPLLSRDQEVLRAHAYHLLILDEAQAIKNPRSKATQVVGSLEARHRLCLTGTPLENHLGELWSLFDSLLPELPGDERRFRRLFRTPIERYGDEYRQEQLRRRVAPLLTLLPELREEGRRVLLLSQFTSMLALIEGELTQGGLREDRDLVKLTGPATAPCRWIASRPGRCPCFS